MPRICFFSPISVEFCFFYLRFEAKGFWVNAKGANPPCPPTPPSPHIRSDPLHFVYQSKAIFAISLKRFLAQHEARPNPENAEKLFENPSTGSQVQPVSSSVRHIIRTKLSYINLRSSRIAAPAYLFLIIFVKAGEIFGIYESAAAWLGSVRFVFV